ncbi:Condensin-2 complex subunit H2 [Holothuria leucospilota]|uniref:Condensin-2 complex subunit H2 n=1 Tax=Holothuria leucospilota TaxID=206669 RepID=A0A9Q0YJQ9_HOLLE|nr:Condensin-2 complex subunit H2 [Holothuria leucospilota]
MLPGGNDEARFGHLLQPIRDLTKNWQVDIATQLEDYLTEIETIQISFDGGATTMNFAEAALLIQGSTCIYSKKVEFLYALVFQTLDALASKKKMQQASSVDAEGRDADTSVLNQSREEFLSLDDIPEAKNINMKQLDGDDHDKTVEVVPRTPLSLLKLDELDRGMPLLNRKGETLGFKGDFKMNAVHVHCSGALLLEPAHYSLLEQSLMRHPASTPVVPKPSVDEDDNLIPDMPADDDGPPGLDVSLDDIEMGDALADLNNSVDDIKEEVDVRKAGLRPEKSVRPIQAKVEFKDPWETLDPDEPVTMKERPFKKGRCFRLPPSLEKYKGKKRKRTSVRPPLAPLSDFINKTFYSHSDKLPTQPVKLPSSSEFDSAFWLVYKKHEASLRREKSILMKQGQKEADIEEQLYSEQIPEVDIPGVGDDHFDEDGDAGMMGGFDGMEFDDLGAGLDAPGGNEFSQHSGSDLVTDYENLVREYVAAYMASAEEYAQVTELSKRVQQWEDKLTPILKREEEQGFFDIHEYGTTVLSRLQKCTNKTTDKVQFSKVVEDTEIYDISRMFLATLQLANNYNVEVSSAGPGETGMDTMKLKLLSTTRHHEEMAEYKAPSLKT